MGSSGSQPGSQTRTAGQPQPWLRGVDGAEVLPLIERDDPVLRIEAPPGAGKSFGLSRRVVRLLHPDGGRADPEDVLVVAFNRVIATDLKSEISREVERFGMRADDLTISTLHGLCNKILGSADRRIVLPHERDIMIHDVMYLDPSVRSEFGAVPQASQALRNHEAQVDEHHLLWTRCQEWLDAHLVRLIGDAPDAVVSQIRNGDHADYRYSHVLVDEFQDLTPTEQRLTSILRRPESSLVALGDPQQSIYLFRGNDRDGLAKLEELTGEEVKDVPMPTCRRCPAPIVEAANQLMIGSGRTIESAGPPSANLHAVHWKSLQAEAKGLAKAIRSSWGAAPTEKHLVMVTRRASGYLIRDELRSIDPHLRVHLSFSESILERWEVREAFLWFCLMANPDPSTWRSWFAYQTPTGDGVGFKSSGRNAPAYFALRDAVGTIDRDAVLALSGEPRGKRRGAGGTRLWDRADRYRQILCAGAWEEMGPTAVIDACFDPVKSVLFDAVDPLAAPDLELLKLQAARALQETGWEAGEVDGAIALARITEDLRYRIATREPWDTTADDMDIHITTMWGAKGLTADHVYLACCCDEALPGRRPDEYPGTEAEYIEEQRRLFFVSLTRTRRTLVLSMPKSVANREALTLNLHSSRQNGPHRRFLTTSRFVRAAGGCLPDAVDGEHWNVEDLVSP